MVEHLDAALQRLPDATRLRPANSSSARLLRACLHGADCSSLKLDHPALADVELYIRDTMLDTGAASTRRERDPSGSSGASVGHYLSPISGRCPDSGWLSDDYLRHRFLTSAPSLNDGSNGVGTNSPPPTVQHRV